MPLSQQQSPTSPSTPSNDQQQTILQTILKKYNLESIQQLSHILFDPQLSQLFKNRFPQLSPSSSQPQLSSRLQKMALQHSYHEMYIYYQQFPHLLEECKNVLKFKYHFDDILRTHNNRKSIWLLCSGALRRIKENPGYYESIDSLRNQYPQYFSNTIEKDVVRTISQQQTQQRQSLSRILRNFSIRNPYIGYCQGMNFIVSFLLQMQFSQQQIFWLMVEMFQNHLPKSYYTNMMGVGVDICIMEYYIKVYYPQLSQKLAEMGLSLSLFTLEWLVCLFTNARNRMGHVTDLWSVYLNKSVPNHVRLTGRNHLEYNRFISAQLLVIIQEKKKGIFIDQNKFIARITAIYVDQQLLSFCRELIEIKLQQDKTENNKHNNKNLQVNCNIQWPICHKTLKSFKADLGEIQIWTFKQQNPPKLIKDYLFVKNKKSYKPFEDNRPKQKKIMLGRIPHTCDINRYNRKQSIENQQSIQLEELNKSQQKMIFEKLQSITERLGIENQHVKFFRRAASQLNVLKFSILKQNHSKKSFVIRQDKNQDDINGLSSSKNTSTIVNSDTKNYSKHLFSETPSLINQDPLLTASKKTRNPFKKLKNKWNQRKNKQKTNDQS